MSQVNTSTQILIADTQYLIIASLKILLEDGNRYAVHTVTNKYDLETAMLMHQVSVLIVDFVNIDFDGISDLQNIKAINLKLSILILINSIGKSELLELNSIGIQNIILKNADKDEILSAIDATVKGKKYYSEEVLDMLFELNEQKKSGEEPDVQLTRCELEIVQLIADGNTTKEIALLKHVSFHTVMSHRKNIFRKLSINNASELLMYAVKAGLVSVIEYHI